MGRTGEDGDGVLIPTGHEAASYTCVRSLARRGIRPVVASEKAGVPAAASRFCAESASLPDPREDLLAYRDELLALAGRETVRTVIPTRPEDCYLLSRYAEEFAGHVSLVVPSMTQLYAVHDRLELAAVAEAAGVPVPETRRLGDVEGWSGDLIVKSRYNVLADAYLDAFSPHEIDVVKDTHHVCGDRSPEPAEVRRSMGHEPVVQEFVHHDGEYVFTALYDRGTPLATFQHRQIRGNSYTGGGGVYRKSTYEPELERVGRALLDHLDWHGLACIEYMKDERTGEFVLTEVNPRMWQSLPSTVRAGADYPYYYWLAATGRGGEIDPDYRLGVGSHWLYGELGYVVSLLTEDSPHVPRPSLASTVWQIAASLVREPHFDYLSLDDPGPFLAGVRRVLSD